MKTVYMCFSTDILHSGNIAIIRRAAQLGELTVGVLTDEALFDTLADGAYRDRLEELIARTAQPTGLLRYLLVIIIDGHKAGDAILHL